MAPKAAVARTAIHTNGLAGSDQRSVGNRMAMAMSTPPMVGVPDFFWCDCGSVFADVLADLEFAQFFDHIRADEKSDQKRRAGRKGGAKREIAKNTKRMEERVELLIQQPVKQVASRAGMRRDSD